MKVIPIPGTRGYRLEAETEADFIFMGDLDDCQHALHCAAVHRTAVPGELCAFRASACVLDIDPKSPAALEALADRQCLGSLRQLGGLIFESYPPTDAQTTEKPSVDLSMSERRAIPRRMSVWINHRHFLCPYCKRKFSRSVRHDPAIKAAASRHVHACYERRLFAAGYVLLANRIAPAAEASQKMLARLRKPARKAQ